MKDYVIITDSCCDLSPELAAKADVRIIPMILTLDGKEYRNYPDEREITSKEFYDKLRSGLTASTAAINMDIFMNEFEPILKEGKDILYLAFSSGLSSTCNTGTIVASELNEKYPENKICCVDTLAASMGEGLLVYLAAMKRQTELLLKRSAIGLKTISLTCATGLRSTTSII